MSWFGRRAATTERLRQIEATQRAGLDALEQGVSVFRVDGTVELMNRAGRQMLGYAPEELTEMFRSGRWQSYTEDGSVLTPEERPIRITLDTGRAVKGAVVRWVAKDGVSRCLRVSTEPVLDATGQLSAVVVAFADVTADRAAQAALRASQARFEALVERSTDIICLIDAAGCITYASPAGERVLGYRPDRATGVAFAELVHPDDAAAVGAAFADLVEHPGAVRTAEARVRNRHGDWRHMEIVATNRFDDPAVEGIVANVRDVTDRAEAAARLSWQAFHDPLTGLPNRALLLDRLHHALGRARRSGERTALLFVDLDRFKLVNDTMGHEAGDQLLIEVAARLAQVVRADDTVARLGGDEFVVLAESLKSPADATAMAQRFIDALAAPISLAQGDVTVSGSIGIAFDLDHRPESLLREADTALYRAKEQGKNRYEVFDESLRVEAVRRMATEQLLRRALDDGGLAVHYQPIVDLTTGAVVSAEALLRIPGPDGELRSPADFISVAEESGLIVPIGAGVLDAACAQLARWRRELGIGAPGRVAVNISARQLSAPGFGDLLDRALATHGLRADDLILEFTESTMLEADEATLRTLDRLHELGVGLAVDDFGTGYSSLAYLKRFPIDVVKLDRTFVDGLGTDLSDTEIVRAVVSLGRSLGLVVVAEGIETPDQLSALVDLGCDCGQGYLLGRPGPAETFEDQRNRVFLALNR